MAFSIDRPLSAVGLTVLLVLTTSSCHKKLVAVPVPSEPPPAVVVPHDQPPTTPTQPASATTTNPVPAPTTAAPAPASPPKEESKYQKNKPPDQPPPPKRAARPANPVPAAAPTPANATPADPPRLGDILTPEQQHQYNAAIDVSLAHAQASIDFIATRQLSTEQQATVAEILNFMQQAQEKRKNELGAAKSLAERAEVLSHDLVATLRGH
jgi:hypothetical protein